MEEPKPTTRFIVVQLNMLADINATPEAFPHVDPEHLAWGHRFGLFKLFIDELRPDIICLQEVNHYKLIHKFMGEIGYSGRFRPFNKMTIGDKEPRDCMATFWKQSVFQSVSSDTIPLGPDGYVQVAGLVKLTHKESGRNLQVICTHLKAKAGFEHVRLQQATELVRIAKISPLPTIICGDLNALPDSDTVKMIDLEFKSTQPLDDPTIFTTAKNRTGELELRCSDYIFLDKGLAGPGFSMRLASDLPKSGLPSDIYFSDHVPVVAVLHFTTKEQTLNEAVGQFLESIASVQYNTQEN